ncbi:hypothetical protein CWB99_09570 [Pseudoalteromonas rubra]|uniref:Streptomycin biosynthesis enzyme StrG n=1 Tax=Pseudoalteromonas rubra TaxID=43658 RepID=A0A5S3WN43_9GAMM|nr:hypothetical protein [Pseudoalteromonas rubra]TMP29009.1 hypothetical protein CWB99_09570 [Pseudoalteromonas rubra]TMP29191.1 hypothetical protein CWC00_19805 [Pseudoalteromonas rubra]
MKENNQANAVFKIVEYDTQEYDFATIIADKIFNTQDLALFHRAYLLKTPDHNPDELISYKQNITERKYLADQAKPSGLLDLYYRFVEFVIAPLFHNNINFPAEPVFRVQMAGSSSVSAWHRDTEVTGQHNDVTVWVPFVDTQLQNTIWCETQYGRGDYQPISVKYGQALLFDSGYLSHGSVTNTSETTRMSMDFRIVPRKQGVEQPDLGILQARPENYRMRLKLPSSN